MTTLLLLQPEDKHSADPLARAAVQAGWKVEQPFGGLVPPEYRQRQTEVVLYGDWRLLCNAADLLNIALLAPTADWLTSLPAEYRLRQMQYMTWGEALKLEEPFFIKPLNWKWGKAKVYSRGADLPDPGSIPPDMTMLVSEPVEFEIEFRLFILERRVMTLSPYYQYGKVCYDRGHWVAPESSFDEALEFARRLLEDQTVSVPPAFVMDAGRMQGRGWGVVEAQPCWFSSIYGCNARDVLPVLRRACRYRPMLSPDDRPWVLQGRTLAG
jgi:hypothetical protein